MHEDIYVYKTKLGGPSEAISPNNDGTYTIWIEQKLSDEKALAAYEHALQHIRNRDFEGSKSVTDMEAEAHKKSPVARAHDEA